MMFKGSYLCTFFFLGISMVLAVPLNDYCSTAPLIDLSGVNAAVVSQYSMAAQTNYYLGDTWMTIYVQGNNIGATYDSSVSSCTGSTDVWFRIRAPSSTYVYFDTCMVDTNFDTTLCLLSMPSSCADSCSAMSFVASDDDNGLVCTGLHASLASFLYSPCYTVRLSGFGANTGSYILRLTYMCPGGTCYDSSYGIAPDGGAVISFAGGSPGGGGGGGGPDYGAASTAWAVGTIIWVSIVSAFVCFSIVIVIWVVQRRRQNMMVTNRVVTMQASPMMAVAPMQPMMTAPAPMMAPMPTGGAMAPMPTDGAMAPMPMDTGDGGVG